MRKLLDKRVLVTGAGSGLGKAITLHFARNGWRVAATDLRADSAQQTLAEMQNLGTTGLALPQDVTSEESWSATVDQLKQAWGGLDVLVNNAGVATAGTVAESPIEQWQWVFNINFLGCVRGARAVIPLLTAQKGGHIVNVASFAGIANPPALASYNAAKAAVISLSETLRFEMFPHGVGVTVACPSFFKTNLLVTSQAAAPASVGAPPPQMMKITDHLMTSAKTTAQDVAADIYDAVIRNRFLTLTHSDAKQRAFLKRIAPEFFFKIAQKMTATFLETKHE